MEVKRMLTQIESTEQFESAVNGYSPLLVEFFQPWCKYCQAFFPTLEEFAAQGTIPVIQVSGEEFPQIFDAYGVDSYPTLIVFRGGQPFAKHAGSMPMEELKNKDKKALQA